MARPDDRPSGGHEHTENVELADNERDSFEDDDELEQPERAIPNSAVAEAARRRRAEGKAEELDPEALMVREFTDAIPPPPPPPASTGGGSPARRQMTTADEPDGDGGDGDGGDGAREIPAEDEPTSASKAEEWTSHNGPPAPPESSRVAAPNSWLSREK